MNHIISLLFSSSILQVVGLLTIVNKLKKKGELHEAKTGIIYLVIGILIQFFIIITHFTVLYFIKKLQNHS